MKNSPKNKFIKSSPNTFNKNETNKFKGNKNKDYYDDGRRFNESRYKKNEKSDKFNRINLSSNNKSKINKFDQNIYRGNYQNHMIDSAQRLDDLIWGKHSVLAVLESDRPVNRIWCTSEVRSSEKFFLILKNFKTKGVLLEEVPWSRISQITSGGVHQGIALQVAYSKTIPLKELIETSKTNNRNPIIIGLDGITDPHNVGAIIRSAEAFGCSGLILPQRRSAGITGTVAKVSAGALEHLAITRVVNLNRALEELKKEGFLVIGLTSSGKLNINNFKEPPPLVILIGSEDKGLSLLTQKNCDHLLRIPLMGKTSSLNASVAAAISLFQLSKVITK